MDWHKTHTDSSGKELMSFNNCLFTREQWENGKNPEYHIKPLIGLYRGKDKVSLDEIKIEGDEGEP